MYIHCDKFKYESGVPNLVDHFFHVEEDGGSFIPEVFFIDNCVENVNKLEVVL